MAFTLPDLPYAYDALEPHFDAKTMEIHHTKHHAGYASKVSAALEGHALAEKPIEEVLQNLDTVDNSIRQGVINNGGGYANHNLFAQVDVRIFDIFLAKVELTFSLASHNLISGGPDNLKIDFWRKMKIGVWGPKAGFLNFF